MTAATIFERVRNAIGKEVTINRDLIKPDASFRDDLGMDSLDEVQVVMSLEEEFGIEISDDDAWKLQTVADAVKFIERALS